LAGIIRRTHESVMSGSFWGWIGHVFFVIGKYFTFFLFLTVFFMIGTIIFNGTAKGETQVLATRLDTTISNTKILSPIYTGLKDTLKFVNDPTVIERSAGWKSEVDNNKDNQNLGLRFIRKFSPIKPRILPNEEATLTTAVEISSLKQDSNIRFSCTSKNIEDGVIKVSPNEPVKISKNEIKRFDIVCRIPGDTFKDLESGLQVAEKKIKLNAVYDFKTESYLDIYTMQKSYLDNAINHGINPFEKEINPNLNKNTGETIPITTYGPMKLILRLDYTQPLTEQGPFTNDNTYNIGLKIQKTSSSWFGRLNKINQVYISLPKNFRLVDENFEEVFDFSDTNYEGDTGFKKYKLNQKKIDELNNQCDLSSKISQECNDLYEQGFIIAFTKFKVEGLDQPTLLKDLIRAEADYDFQAEASSSITLVKSFV